MKNEIEQMTIEKLAEILIKRFDTIDKNYEALDSKINELGKLVFMTESGVNHIDFHVRAIKQKIEEK